jgi:ABC-2 type transport system ATP-binding protein
VAVNRVSFEVGSGEVVGFIGPNGAGKTTTMRMLTGYLPATEGVCVVAGHDVFEDPMAVRQRVGYLPETPPLYPELTIGDYLHFVAEIRGLPSPRRSRRIGEVMERVGLAGWESRILGSLSKGYRQRVGLAQAVLNNPEVLILDEPTSGLDPAQVVGIRQFIQDLARERTVILSTHILSEVELLARRAVVINRGQVVADDSLDGLKARVGAGLRYRVSLRAPGLDESALALLLAGLPGVEQVRPLGPEEGRLAFELKAPIDPREDLSALALARGWGLAALERVAPTLEEAFLAIVGQEGV